MEFSVKGNIVDIEDCNIFSGTVHVLDGKISSVVKEGTADKHLNYILPGFIDAHVHVESSMLVPSEFARLAVVHGTIGAISDPHEIANVCGVKGVEYMIENGKQVPFKFHFGAPSCVPATNFEMAGAKLDEQAVIELLEKNEISYLSEMMNFPGVLQQNEVVLTKINAAIKHGKPIDGHAPGLRGEEARKYIQAGRDEGPVVISTDHECFTEEEALDKLKHGMKILIREGSAAKNFEALVGLLGKYPNEMMFCSDDKHPDSLVKGHINDLCKRAVQRGIDVFKVLKAACINPVRHYKMKVGLLQAGDPADFIEIKDLLDFKVLKTFIDGKAVAENGTSLIEFVQPGIVNNFNCSKKEIGDFAFPAPWNLQELAVIEALDEQLITNRLSVTPKTNDGFLVSDTDRDILKIVVVNRYAEAPIAKAFVKNFGLKSGSIASSVAHDSHNIIAVGTDDRSLCEAVNKIIKNKGGICCVEAETLRSEMLPLPVAGLMSSMDGYKVAWAYTAVDKMAKDIGSGLSSPFMTLSFMALLVIPHIKLSDLGLFDGDKFEFI